MKLSVAYTDKEIVGLQAEGTITSADYQAGQKNPVEMALGSGWGSKRILLDLDKTPYIDSSGIGWLMDVHRNCKGNGGKLVIHSLQPAVRQMLSLLKLEKVLTFANDKTAATEVANGGGK